jgi:hypothetical protein
MTTKSNGKEREREVREVIFTKIKKNRADWWKKRTYIDYS